jgi:hypothetical protein
MALTVVGLPTGMDDVVRVAVPELTLAVPKVTEPSVKVSYPDVGLPLLHPVPLVQTTVAVRVTGVP